MLYHGLFHVHVTHVRIQDSIPTEITCFKNKTFKTPFLQKCTSKMCVFFFFGSQTLPSYTKHTFSLAEWAIPWRLILQTSGTTKDWLTQWRFLAKWDVQNTLTPHLRIYHSSMVCWCLSVYSFIYIYIHIISFWRERWYSYILYCKLLYPTDVSVTGNTTAEVFVFLAELQKLRLRLPLITAVDTLT